MAATTLQTTLTLTCGELTLISEDFVKGTRARVPLLSNTHPAINCQETAQRPDRRAVVQNVQTASLRGRFTGGGRLN